MALPFLLHLRITWPFMTTVTPNTYFCSLENHSRSDRLSGRNLFPLNSPTVESKCRAQQKDRNVTSHPIPTSLPKEKITKRYNIGHDATHCQRPPIPSPTDSGHHFYLYKNIKEMRKEELQGLHLLLFLLEKLLI